MSSRIQSFLRDRNARAQFAFALFKVAAPIGLVVALLLAGAPERPDGAVAAAQVPVPVPQASHLR